MLNFLAALLLTIIWAAFAICALCLASAADDDDFDQHDHDRSMTGD